MIKRNGQKKYLGWIGEFQEEGKKPFIFGTVYTYDYAPTEAKEKLLQAVKETHSGEAILKWYGRGRTEYILEEKKTYK